jgi:hypothetical protein
MVSSDDALWWRLRPSCINHRMEYLPQSAAPPIIIYLSCPSLREALLGPAGAAYMRSNVVVATDGLVKKSWIMEVALVLKESCIMRRC